jgi:heme exporter protein CcmD
MSLRDFLAMGAYGAYVWPCYGLTVAVLIWSAWSARRQLRNEILAAQRRVQAQSETQS